jgi:hypothetical protein
MASAPGSSLWRDRGGNPSRWVALALALMFGAASVVAGLTGQGSHETAALGALFVVAFNAAFGRRSVPVQIAAALGHRERNRP